MDRRTLFKLNYIMHKRNRRRPSLLGKFQTVIDGEGIIYTLKRSYSTRYVRLEIKRQTGLTVFIPRFYKFSDVSELLVEKSRWIMDKLSEFKQVQLAEKNKISSGSSILYLGKRIKLKSLHNPDALEEINLDENNLTITHNNKEVSLSRILEWWYRKQAENVIRNRVDELGFALSINYNRVTIRQAKTRWGSCSQKGNLNFNWKLIMLPEPVIDYIIIHELCHLKEMNHSGKFWALVAEYCPQWRHRRKWLKDHETELAISSP